MKRQLDILALSLSLVLAGSIHAQSPRKVTLFGTKNPNAARSSGSRGFYGGQGGGYGGQGGYGQGGYGQGGYGQGGFGQGGFGGGGFGGGGFGGGGFGGAEYESRASEIQEQMNQSGEQIREAAKQAQDQIIDAGKEASEAALDQINDLTQSSIERSQEQTQEFISQISANMASAQESLASSGNTGAALMQTLMQTGQTQLQLMQAQAEAYSKVSQAQNSEITSAESTLSARPGFNLANNNGVASSGNLFSKGVDRDEPPGTTSNPDPHAGHDHGIGVPKRSINSSVLHIRDTDQSLSPKVPQNTYNFPRDVFPQ